MKKIAALAIFFIMFCASSPFSYGEEAQIPVWEDFCPKEFLGVRILTREEYCAKFPSILPPLNSTIREYNENVQYWLDRKAHFDEYLKTCGALPEKARGVCYSKLEESQIAENKSWKNREKTRQKKESENANRLRTNEMQRLNNQMRQFNPMY